jgi:nucleoid-associated protein YgaU
MAILVAGMLVGCGPRGTPSKGIQATGTATLDGTPLEMGLVVLEPEGGGESASGQIAKDGSFKLYDVKPGRYKVAVQTAMFAGMAAQGKKASAGAGDGRPVAVRNLDGTLRPVPAKFEKAATSGLSVEIKAGQPVTIDIIGK